MIQVFFCFLSLAQISSEAQSRQSSLFRRGCQHKVQRPDPCREQQPDWEALWNLRLTGAAATLVFRLLILYCVIKCPLSVCIKCVCPPVVCLYLSTLHTVISLNSSGIQLRVFRFTVFRVSSYCPHGAFLFIFFFLSVHLNAFNPAEVVRYSLSNAQGEMRY